MTTPYASEAFLHQVLGKALAAGASDVHLKVGKPPGARVRGELVYFRVEKLRAEDTEAVARMLLGAGRFDEVLGRFGHHVFAYEAAGIARFRVSLYEERGSIALVLRSIPLKVPTFAELGVPAAAIELVEQEAGLVLVAGGTGQGKSSTLAAMVGHLDQSYAKHVITIENPIEHVHGEGRGSVCQREVGEDVKAFAKGVRAAMAQDADVIVVSDLTEVAYAYDDDGGAAETLAAALDAAELGHLVIAAMAAPSAAGAISRLLAAGADRARLAAALQGVLAQRLLPKRDGTGVVLASEVLIATAAVRETLRAGEGDLAAALRDHMEKGASPYGMATFEMAQRQLVAQGAISKSFLAGAEASKA